MKHKIRKVHHEKRLFFLVIFLIFLISGWFAIGIITKPQKVQIFLNGTIYLDAEKKIDNLLVKNGTVVDHNVNPFDYPKAEIIDLHGAVAYPGFNDSHVHLMESAYFFNTGANLLNKQNADDIALLLAEKVKSLPEDSIVLGLGFSLRNYDDWSLSDLAKIDAATDNHPAFLGDKLGHNAIINTAAIRLTGITPQTPIPLGGKMGVENGKLTGMLRESALILPFNKLFPLFDKQTIKQSTLKMAQRWAAIGYTGIVELMGGPGARFMMPEIFYELEKEGVLPLRVNYAYTIFNLHDVDDAAQYRGKDTDMVRFLGCKIFVDGAYAGGQAWTSWVNQLGNHGLQEIYTDDVGGKELNLNRIIAKVEEYGMNIHYHTQGDLAINAVLDALDNARTKNGKIKGIHTLIHLAFPTDEQITRIKSFNGHVVTTVQPGFWPIEADAEYYYGAHAKSAYPIKKLIDNGISVGISTDFSVSPPEYTPVSKIFAVSVTGAGDPIIHEPLTVKDVLTSLTQGSAKTTGKNDTGSLRIGYKADLVVYDKDFYTIPLHAFDQIPPKVLSTYVGGRKMYEAK